jgi:broad specificity phosphatase PhoE
MPARLFAVRHGETEWSLSGQHTGRTDVPLTDAGRERAMQVGDMLAGRSFALVLTSPFSRARDTAALAGFPDALVDDDLREWDYGDYEGRKTLDIRKERPGWFLWDDGVPNGETIEEVAARADRVITRVREVDGDVLVFAHGHILRVLAARWLEQPPGFGRHLILSPATLSILAHEREAPALETWNAAVHAR